MGSVDYGTVATAERWMGRTGGIESTRTNEPMYGNGVERVVATPALGDEDLHITR